MIEVERKFKLTPEEEQHLLEGAEFLAEKKFTDEYYDASDFALSRKDWWLRKRAGKFELKIGKKDSTHSLSDTYQELEDDASILQALGLSGTVITDESLRVAGYEAFCSLTTVRRHYTKEGFTIDIDSTTSTDDPAYRYEGAEIELLLDDVSKRDEAIKRIVQFAERHGLTFKRFPGKVFSYIERYRPEHFQALTETKVINRHD